MPVYMGHNSCYARREGFYVRRFGRPGIDTVAEAAGILHLIIRDLRRGWTYDADRDCRKIRMGKELFVDRANYVRVLARRHGAGPRTLAVIDRLVEYVIASGRLPVTVSYHGRRYRVESLINAALAKA